MKRAVFLDRDGVLNDSFIVGGKPYPPRSLKDFKISDGVIDACKVLKDSKFELVVVTNQPDVRRGVIEVSLVEEFHKTVKNVLGINHFYVCYHDDEDNCLCRKPRPGLVLQAVADLGIDLGLSFLVGDRWRDIEASNAVGCNAIFVDHLYNEKQPQNYFAKVSSLYEAAMIIVGGEIE